MKKNISSNNLLYASASEFQALQSKEPTNCWGESDIKSLGDRYQEFKALGYIEYTIKCNPSRNWIRQPGVIIPGNSIIRLYNYTGSMEMGWNRYVDPTGKFLDNGERLRAISPDFTASPDWNAFCFLVSTPTTVFKNTQIPNYGASVGDLYTYWTVDADDGGICETAFNDTDNNNSGAFLQILRIEPINTFIERNVNLLGTELGNGFRLASTLVGNG